jgi:GNAT superfamily N-acetyltransferase
VHRALNIEGDGAIRLRPLQPGDLGWVIGRHGALYAAEYGLDGTFEIAVAEIVVEIMQTYNPDRDGAWIAELDGKAVGSAFVVGVEDRIAKLRLVIVDPAARGRGVGRMLTRAAIGFARAQGYTSMMLWTMSMLTAARAIYASEGFQLVASVPGETFGCRITDETWVMDLTSPGQP